MMYGRLDEGRGGGYWNEEIAGGMVDEYRGRQDSQ
jgi:hypothetical protein